MSQLPPTTTKTEDSVAPDRFSISNDAFPIKDPFIKIPDDYLTPDSKGSLSENDGYQERRWTEDELRFLNYFVHYDLTASTIKRCLPDVGLDTVASKLKSISRQPDWTRAEVVLLADHIQGGDVEDVHAELPLRTDHSISSKVDMLKQKLKSLQFPTHWCKRDISLFLYQSEYDLTSSGLFEEFPDVDPNDFEHIYTSVPDWTPVELAYLQHAKAQDIDTETVMEELPLRTSDDVNKQIQTVKPRSITFDNELLDYLKHYTICSLTDLRFYFPGVPTRELVLSSNTLRRRLDLETEFLKQACQDKKSETFVQALLPLRSFSSISSYYKEFKDIYRKKRFRNSLDELIYMSQWYTSEEFGTHKKRRTRKDAAAEKTLETQQSEAESEPTKESTDQSVGEPKSPKKEPASKTFYAMLCDRVPYINSISISFEEYKAQVQEEAELKRQRESKLEQKRLEKLQKRLESRKNPKPKIMRSSASRNSVLQRLKRLETEAAYFQSVTGDKQLVKDNEKRKRQQTVFLVPQFEDRQKLKKIMKKKVIKKKLKATKTRAKKKPGRRKKADPVKQLMEESDHSSSPEDEEDDDEDDDDEEEEVVSPFDPYDITVDTTFDAPGRQLFVDSIYKEQREIPQLQFLGEDLETDILEDMKKDLYETDVLSAKIVLDFPNCYKSLGSSFPQLWITNSEGKEVLNPNNKIRLRTLLYPEHKEMFVLAEPKHNELNPLFEMQKFFQIHYCLYFSHSEKLKSIIYEDFCLGLETAVQENNFTNFLSIVDNWNALMLVLSPSYKGDDLVKTDVNSEVRVYNTNNKKNVQQSLKLDVFFSEICCHLGQDTTVKVEELAVGKKDNQSVPAASNTPASSDSLAPVSDPASNDVSGSSADLPAVKNESEQTANGKVEINEEIRGESNLSSVEVEFVVNRMRPKCYIQDFMHRLQQKTTVSRYCMQQILIRVYSRVVSTRSRELRKYKAFTAEVYGELLPSFVSEVLAKVNFNSSQKFYDLGSGVGNTSFQAALEFGAAFSGGCELMEHASRLTDIQHFVLDNHLKVLGIKPLNMRFALAQSFVKNEAVRKDVLGCDVLIVNNYLFDMSLNFEVGRLLYGLKPGTKIISLRNFITPRYKSTGDATVFDYLSVEKHEMSDFFSVSWTANKVPYYISTVEETIQPQYL